MMTHCPLLKVMFAISLALATLSSSSMVSAQENEVPTAPEQPSATYGSAVADASLVYIEVYYRLWVRDPQLNIYFNDGLPFEVVVSCTGWGVAPNHVVTASHCIQTDVSPGTVPYDMIVGPATDFALAMNLYPGLTRGEVSDFGLGSWGVEGDSANSPPEREIFVSYGVVQSGLQGQAGTSTARVVDFISIDQGDVALIGIQDPASLASAPVPVLKLAAGTPAVGSEILSLGYPGAVSAVTSGQIVSPSIQDGRISAVATTSFGGYQVFEVSSTIDSGMSGGPTINFNGEVVGVNSFGVVGTLDSFKFVSPAERFVGELLARNGVANELSGTDITYRQAVTHFLAGNYTDAIALFDQTLERMPAHRRAQEMRIESVRLRDEVGDATTVPPVTEPLSSSLAPTTSVAVTLASTTVSAELVAAPLASEDESSLLLPLLLVGVGLAGIAVAAALFVRRSASPNVSPPELVAADPDPAPLPATPAADQGRDSSLTGELERLSELHKSGELSDEEFLEFKHQLFHTNG